jgi:hypothetical protein
VEEDTYSMESKFKILIFLIVGLIACRTGIRLTQTYIGGWSEKQIGFVNSIPHVDFKNGYFNLIMESKWGGIGLQDLYLTNEKPFDWIRKSDNILILHNTIKKIGYKNFISDSEYHQPMRFQDKFGGMNRHTWEDLSLVNIVDNLIKTYYQAIRIDTGYYEEFWNRRAKEGNIAVVIVVLEEIKKIYSDSDITKDFTTKLVNDTIERLLNFDLQLQAFNNRPTKEFLFDYFDYLHKIGLNHSAYNLVIEKYPGKIKLDTVISILNLDTIPENDYWNTRNNGTWIYTYDDNGP